MAKEAKNQVKVKKSNFKSKNPAMVLVSERDPFGTASMFTKPVYVPPDIEIAWATHPREDDGANLRRRFTEGYDRVTKEMITDDLNEAMERGLICLHPATYGSIVETDGLVGLGSYGLVLLFREKEVGEKVRQKLIERYENTLQHRVGEVKGEVEENTAEVDYSKLASLKT